MKTYQRVNLAEVENIKEYITKMLKDGHALIEIWVNDGKIFDLVSFGNVKSNKDSWFSSLIDEGQQLKDLVISQSMVPCYIEDEKRVDIENDSQRTYTFEEAIDDILMEKEHFSGEEYEDDGLSHYEFYASIGEGNLGDLGASMECEFVEEWVADNGWKQVEEIDEDF